MSNRGRIQPMSHPGSRTSGGRAADKRFKLKNPNMLSKLRIRASSRRQYRYGMNKFLNWLPKGEQIWDGAHLDNLLRAFAHHVFTTYGGKYRSWVQQARNGIAFRLPEYASQLRLINLDLQGWKNAVPETHIGPIPKIAAYAIAHRLQEVGCADFAAAVLLSFDCYFRVGDIYNLTRKSFVRKGEAASNNNFIVVVHHSKTKGENQTVEIRAPFLSKYIKSVFNARKVQDGDESLMGLSRKMYSRALELAARDVGLPFRVTPHMLRFGGATHDFLNEVPFIEIKQRGRWISEKQCKTYINVKAHQDQLKSLSTDQHRRWSRIVTNATQQFSQN